MQNDAEQELLNQFRFKVMDHAILAAQTFLDTFLKIGTVYLTVIGIYFAVAYSELAPERLVTGFRVALFLFTLTMVAFGVLFHFLVHKSFKYYFLMAEDLGGQDYLPGIARGRRLILIVGRSLLVAFIAALLVFSGLLVDSFR